jgi:hypothetical protein
MQVVPEVCCGLDVHKKGVTACVLFTRELLELAIGGAPVDYPMCDGLHGSAWEAGVEPSGRAVCGAVGECAAHQSSAWAEDGSEGLRCLRAVLGEPNRSR